MSVQVGIVMGSASDAETMQKARAVLDEFDISSDIRVLSAHRTPEEAIAWVRERDKSGVQVFIAAAGLAAHLAGAVAAHTLKPVIGVPMAGGPLNGMDALLSTVQMPKGTPVATVAIGSAGAVNAALLAVRIMALSDGALLKKLQDYQKKLTADVLASNESLGG